MQGSKCRTADAISVQTEHLLRSPSSSVPGGSSVYGKREVPGQDFVAGRYGWFSRDQLSKCHLQSTLILLTELFYTPASRFLRSLEYGRQL